MTAERPAVLSWRTSGDVAARAALVALTVAAVAAVHLRHRPATVCLLRAVTGVPCPFCGGTTAAVRLGSGDLVGALRASPLAVVALVALPLRRVVHAAGPWQRRAVRVVTLAAVLTGAELWQLHRYGWLW